MQRDHLNRITVILAFILGLLCIVWVASGFVGTSGIALAMTAAIAVAYITGALELRRFRAETAMLVAALNQPVPSNTAPAPAPIPNPPNPVSPANATTQLSDWLQRIPTALQYPVRQRIEGERTALPGLALTPYLIGLLVMLGMLGTFLGMVVTFKGAVFALEGSADLAAIRAALAAPIKGLGLAFGTSVAGVATSAMLGLIAAMSRRQRLSAVRQLDALITTHLRPLSAAYQRENAAAAMREAALTAMHEQAAALREQATALPMVTDKLQALMQQIDQRSQQLDEQLLARQDQFHRDATVAYTQMGASVTQLGTSVAQSLHTSLVASANAAASSLQPVVESAMQAIATESQYRHTQLSETVQAQLHAVTEQFGTTASTVAGAWEQALQTHAHTNEALVEQLNTALSSLQNRLEERTTALLAETNAAMAHAQAERTAADEAQRNAWTQSLHTVANTLQTQWSDATAANVSQQRTVCDALEHTAASIQERASQQSNHTADHIGRLLQTSDALVQQRTATEEKWAAEHTTRMDAMAALWRTELSALRSEESTRSQAAAESMGQWQNSLTEQLHTLHHAEDQRAQAAVDRLGELQSALATHLATLGTALEAPLTRLLETSAQAPRAAAEVIAQLRTEMATITERDTQRDLTALQERTTLVDNIGQLMKSVQQATDEQRASIEALVSGASGTLHNIGQQFSDTLVTQTQQNDHTAAQLAASAEQLHSLGETFATGVAHFSASNQQLTEHLERTTAALQNSTARSDEQLAYYIAQAREVVDLSITAQQSIVQDLRRLRSPAAPSVKPAESATK